VLVKKWFESSKGLDTVDAEKMVKPLDIEYVQAENYTDKKYLGLGYWRFVWWISSRVD
jgi:hypothetical protein